MASEEGHIVIIDFGVSDRIPVIERKINQAIGTPFFMPIKAHEM